MNKSNNIENVTYECMVSEYMIGGIIKYINNFKIINELSIICPDIDKHVNAIDLRRYASAVSHEQIKKFINLKILKCRNISDINILYEIPKLRVLTCTWYEQLIDFSKMSSINTLTELNCSHCKNVINIGYLKHLRILKCIGCNETNNLDIGNLNDLEYLECSSTNVENFDKLTNIKTFICQNNDTIKMNISCLKNLENLDCSGNDHICGYDKCLNLTELKCEGCHNMKIHNLKNLYSLSCYDSNISDISKLQNLQYFDKLKYLSYKSPFS